MDPEQNMLEDDNRTTSSEVDSDSSPRDDPIDAATVQVRRMAVKERIERYFYQLQRGCGNSKCGNVNCASSGLVFPMTPNEIAARAIQLFSQNAKLCEYILLPLTGSTNVVDNSPTVSYNTSTATTPGGNQDPDAISMNGSNPSTSVSTSTITSGSNDSNSITTANTTSTNNFDYAIVEALLETYDLEPTSASSYRRHLAEGRFDLTSTTEPPVEYLNETIFDDLVMECAELDNNDRLLYVLHEVFSSVNKLGNSFKRIINKAASKDQDATTSNRDATKINVIPSNDLNNLNKEDIRTLQGENDKDIDSTYANSTSSTRSEHRAKKNDPIVSSDGETEQQHLDGRGEDDDEKEQDQYVDEEVLLANDSGEFVKGSLKETNSLVDFESLRRVKCKMLELTGIDIGETLKNAIVMLTDTIKYGVDVSLEKIVHSMVICFELVTNNIKNLEQLDRALPRLCQAVRVLPYTAHARMARIWAVHSRDHLKSLVQRCQQFISLRVVLEEEAVQDDRDVIATTKVLKIAFYANILASGVNSYKPTYYLPEATDDAANSNDEDDIFLYSKFAKVHNRCIHNMLEHELGVSSMDCREDPIVPYDEFYNHLLSDTIRMDRDYLLFKNSTMHPDEADAFFTFVLYSFILTPAAKVVSLYYDSRIRMLTERNAAFRWTANSENHDSGEPDLRLKVRRDFIIDDALIGLEVIAMSCPKDLKKQLVVEFVGEQGVDEGGVSKEFFQLIVDAIFNPDYGMFTNQDETNTVWFNSSAFENEAQFTLIGIIIGLAIYNNVILAVNFPMVVYRKLLGEKGTFCDMKDWNPTLYRSLLSLLDYEFDDMEDVFEQTFNIHYKNVFGEVVDYDLKPQGSETLVGQHNKKEFIDLYSDFLLNRNIERQFKAFKRGFDMVTDESPLKLLFRPEEIELLVCGSKDLDFYELETSTEYECGYTRHSQIIKNFWDIVHSMPEELKRKLLEFTTGSDRVPVGGLSQLKLLITRNGPDSDRLPTSHTCFNVLLLPEYISKEKLEERLLKAINYSKGFGML